MGAKPLDGQNHDLPRLLAELKATVESTSQLVGSLERRVVAADGQDVLPGTHAEISKLRTELEETLQDRDQVTQMMVEAENQISRLMRLYVAIHQLHCTLDPKEVNLAIAEIAVDLLGAESYILLLRDEQADEFVVSLESGFGSLNNKPLTGTPYEGSDRLIDSAIERGVVQIDDDESSGAIAAVPLRMEASIIGVLAIFKVFDHKTANLYQDRELLDLLSVHAGSALMAAGSYSTADRKLRTLKSLMSLLPKV